MSSENDARDSRSESRKVTFNVDIRDIVQDCAADAGLDPSETEPNRAKIGEDGELWMELEGPTDE